MDDDERPSAKESMKREVRNMPPKKRRRRSSANPNSNKRRRISANPNLNKPDLPKLKLPWPRKNGCVMRKPGTSAVARCWSFLNSVQDDDILVIGSNIHVTVKSLRRLKPGLMLNDEVVNASFKDLGEKVKLTGRKIKIFSSFFFTTLHGQGKYISSNYNFKATKRWTKSSRLPGKSRTVFDLELMVFPIFLKFRQHWLCGVIVNKERACPKFFLFNSDVVHRRYVKEHRRIIISIQRWWRDERATRMGGFGPSLKATVVSNIPQQGVDSNDCGPICYAYATLACLVSPESSHWPRFLKGLWLRNMMLCSILSKSEKFRSYRSSGKTNNS